MTAPDLESLRPQVLALDSEPARRFALLCGQRVAEVHRLADPTSAPAFDEVLDRLWDSEAVEDAAVNALLLGRVEAAPEDRTATVEQTTACLAYAHRAVAGGAEQAAWCAQQLTDLIDEWILLQAGAGVVDAAAEASVSGHPLYVAELARQERDLAAVAPADGDLDGFRARARTEGAELARALLG